MDRRVTDGFRRVEGEPRSVAGGWVEAARWVGVGSIVAMAAACSLSYVALSTLGAVQALGVAGHPGSSMSDGSTSAREIRIDIVWICVSLLVLSVVVVAGVVRPASLGLVRSDSRPVRLGLLTVAVLGVLHALVGWGPQLLVSATSLVDPNEAMFAGVPVGEALVGSVAAGVGEEVLVLAIPFVLLERAGLTGRRIGRFPMGLVVVGVVLVLPGWRSTSTGAGFLSSSCPGLSGR